MSNDLATLIAVEVMDDLRGRKGVLDDVESDIQDTLQGELSVTIQAALELGRSLGLA